MNVSWAALAPAWSLIKDASPYRPPSTLFLSSIFDRPIAFGGHSLESLAAPLDSSSIFTQRSLVQNQLLFNAYEQSNLYLPRLGFEATETRAFEAYYQPELVAALGWLRPQLENSAFGWMENEIGPGPATGEEFVAHCERLLKQFEGSPSALCARVRAAKSPQGAARMFLIQLAPDFLSEASQMARSMPGNFGPLHAELTKIFIDEFGYGVFDQKHSTLFEKAMASTGLLSHVNGYYPWYLPSSLLMTSYFYRVTTTKSRWFEYLGALYWIEAVVPHFNRQFSTLLKDLFGPECDTQYFDEHVGIDLHHRRMVLERLIKPALELYGTSILPSLNRGLEMARRLGDLAELDYLKQLDLADAATPIAAMPNAAITGPSQRLGAGQVIAPQIADVPLVLSVSEGALSVQFGDLVPHPLAAGQALAIPAGRMFGAQAGEHGATVAQVPSPRS